MKTKNYINKKDMQNAIRRMKSFESELDSVFSNYGYNLRENLGRRNQLLSIAQEKEIAAQLRKKFSKVIEDGRSGQPDIVIADINKEVECKLTSGHGSSRSYDLQTDYDTLVRKGSLDYIYMLADENFENFCVLKFTGLTASDYFPPASGSRGKSRMKKYKAMKKVEVLHGSYEIKNDVNISKLKQKKEKVLSQKLTRITMLYERINDCSEKAVKKKESILGILERETDRFSRKIKKIDSLIKLWEDKENVYKFILEPISLDSSGN